MKTWERALIGSEMTIREALEKIDTAGSQMGLVVDADRRLLGTLSDGDVRRGLLKGVTLTDKVSVAMHLNPRVANIKDDRRSILDIMRREGLHHMPIVNSEGIVFGMEVVDDFLGPSARENWVVIMAGGIGQRLGKLTLETPKPMLQVGSRPLLEIIVSSYAAQGFHRFYFAVNYKAEQIEQHFGDGSKFGVEIRYLREKQRLGTAGALSLLPEMPALPMFVANADLLSKADLNSMLDQHNKSDADVTMAVREYEMQVPFGVVEESDGRIRAIVEKPKQVFTISAGIYILSPQLLDLVPRDTYFDMPSLFDAAIGANLVARCHLIDGYWLDIGHLPDYERANREFHQVF
jgi:dTDP-glucose pyrophosphorylase